MMESSNNLTVIAETEGQSFSIAGGTYRIVISGEQTGGAYAVIEMLVPPNGGPGPHAHADIQESFYVLDGEVEFKSDAGNYIAPKGTFINIPLGGMVHCFKNKTDTLARLWCTIVPAGLETFFEEIGQPVAAGEFSTPEPSDAEAMKKLVAIGERHGQKFFPPDYFDQAII